MGLALDIAIIVAASGRIISAWLNLKIRPLREQAGPEKCERCSSVFSRDLWREFLKSGMAGLTSTWTLLMFGVQVAGPFFVPYMLCKAPGGMGLAEQPMAYTLLAQTSQLVRLLCLPAIGRLVDHFGSGSVLRFVIPGTVLISLGWALLPGYSPIILVEIVSGIVWCAAECAALVFLMSCRVNEGRRAQFVALHVSVASAGTVLGSLSGGWAMTAAPAFNESHFKSLFLLSCLLRIPALILGLSLLPKSAKPSGNFWSTALGGKTPVALYRGMLRYLRRPEG